MLMVDQKSIERGQSVLLCQPFLRRKSGNYKARVHEARDHKSDTQPPRTDDAGVYLSAPLQIPNKVKYC